MYVALSLKNEICVEQCGVSWECAFQFARPAFLRNTRGSSCSLTDVTVPLARELSTIAAITDKHCYDGQLYPS